MKQTRRKIILSVIAFAMTASLLSPPISSEAAEETIDNSSLLPAWVPDEEVELDRNGWPEWTKDIIIAEVNVATATEEGTLAAMDKVLDHYARMGVNCLWIDPVEDMGIDKYHVGYTSYGPHTICPYLTGQIAYGEDYTRNADKIDYEAGFLELKKFVDKAHERNIRIIIDKVTWGLSEHTPLRKEHPEFFTGDTSMWGGPEFDWDSQELIDWYKGEMKKILLVTGCDGIRFDLEPTVAGYMVFEELRDELQEEGRKPLFISEWDNERGYSFAFEQYGNIRVLDGDAPSAQHFPDVFLDGTDLVESVKTGVNIGSEATQLIGESGQYRYYAYQASCHDGIDYHHASLAAWSYEFLYGSFIPIFYIGEEWNAEKDSSAAALYNTRIDWSQLEETEHKEHFEKVKQLIALRWRYKDIFNEAPMNHRDTHIATVKVIGTERVEGYARYNDTEAVLVVPNVNEHDTETAEMKVTVPLYDMKLDYYENYVVTDLLTNQVIVKGSEKEIASFTASIAHDTCGLYHVQAEGTRTLPEDYVEAGTEVPEEEKEAETTVQTGMSVWLLAVLILGGAVIIGILVFVCVVCKKSRKNNKKKKEE